MQSVQYVAFLRGINVGGNTLVKMEKLREVFGELRFANIKTVLNSGNVIFDASETDTVILRQKIKKKLEEAFGFAIEVMIRSAKEIRDLVESDPFKEREITPFTRLYVTFLLDASKTNLPIPYISPEKDFQILQVTKNEVCSVLHLSPERKTTELMNIIEKEFGKKVTTRNWNTLLRIAKIIAV